MRSSAFARSCPSSCARSAARGGTAAQGGWAAGALPQRLPAARPSPGSLKDGTRCCRKHPTVPTSRGSEQRLPRPTTPTRVHGYLFSPPPLPPTVSTAAWLQGPTRPPFVAARRMTSSTTIPLPWGATSAANDRRPLLTRPKCRSPTFSGMVAASTRTPHRPSRAPPPAPPPTSARRTPLLPLAPRSAPAEGEVGRKKTWLPVTSSEKPWTGWGLPCGEAMPTPRGVCSACGGGWLTEPWTGQLRRRTCAAAEMVPATAARPGSVAARRPPPRPADPRLDEPAASMAPPLAALALRPAEASHRFGPKGRRVRTARLTRCT